MTGGGMTEEITMQRSAVIDLIEMRWQALMHGLGADAQLAEAGLAHLVEAYSAPGRHYHTLDHVAALLRLLEQHAAALTDRIAAELAIFFHDAVYEPGRNDNEARSAALAATWLERLGAGPDLIAKVERYILATRHGTDTDNDAIEPDLALLLDLDLSVLGSNPSVYATYAADIRSEYGLLDEATYRAGRRRVLTQFLARPRIYRTEELHAKWDAPARANMTWELGQLDKAGG